MHRCKGVPHSQVCDYTDFMEVQCQTSYVRTSMILGSVIQRSRRATKLNQATTYRVVEGETQNPSLNSLTGIIEAISLTDADAGVLYRNGTAQCKTKTVCSIETANLRLRARYANPKITWTLDTSEMLLIGS